MAFAQGSAVNKEMWAAHRVHFGSFTQANGDVGGSFTTGLRSVLAFFCTGLITYTASGGTVTATTGNPGADQAGSWMAIGY